MTFKKFNKSASAKNSETTKKGQSIFEYFILTILILTVVLFFSSSEYFQNIKDSCKEAMDQGIGQIKGIEEH